ncbi:TetR family transcriptional regulator [Saccharopolyspora erythraea NRRL 2338]|uniref:Transcriptional regulator, TetR family n=2 Tax=Saccharopolyspora erythraea TaxID=1836 RepID=A4F9M2_SACEN|nr:TetR family transcriptional regulator [Saccharopolyspora erythraea]EQD87385.1 TetR family transcriptional regulator [Saccharopolyspora erythraea D]PFG94534.1 TetR family transcriptional regulator [Saccharopolyspora erythraea NRRL 2338]QRK91282.1 TetR family transcriptional regulator [Saccharopolyspora erythraea]CAM00747.1 transcriptional regulator, TetR family [Saccharopolyspora erythraea NRRL 2338]
MSASPRRRRDSAATREALLRAAAELFAERGFEQATVRDVAARAGVNQALLFRYFGSKQELFAEVLARDSRGMLDEPLEELPRRLLEAVLAARHTGEDHPFAAMLRSFSDERAAQLLREELGRRYVARLSELSGADDAELRAEIVLACVFGLGLARSVLRSPALVEAAPEAVAEHMVRVVETLLGDERS